MNRQEKYFLLQIILRDIRGNWGYDLERRADKALEIAQDLNDIVYINSIQEYKSSCLEGDNDGRFFRTSAGHGGYEGMETIHGLTNTFLDKSEELRCNIISYTTYVPEFEDRDRLFIDKYGQWVI